MVSTNMAEPASASIATSVEEVRSDHREGFVSTEGLLVDPMAAVSSHGTSTAFRNGQRSP